MILVIDDELAISELIKTTLETDNYRVLTAQDGAEALAIYADNRDDLIDMMMPVMDGLTTTVSALHQLNPHLPIVAMSGLNSVEAVERAERFGYQHFLTKPFIASDLLRTLNQAS